MNNQPDDIIIRRGDIYFIDLSSVSYANPHIVNKSRPGLVIQNNVGNDTSHNIIIALLTTADKKPYPFQYKITLDGRETTVMFDQIMTLPKINLKNKIGELSARQMFEADMALMCSLDISKYSIANISRFDAKSIITTATRTGEYTLFLFEITFMNGKRDEVREIEIELDELTSFNQSITKDVGLDNIEKLLDCCTGLNFLLSHGRFI